MKYKVGDRVSCSLNKDTGTITGVDNVVTPYSRNYCIDFDNSHWLWVREEDIELLTKMKVD